MDVVPVMTVMTASLVQHSRNATELDTTSDLAELGTLREAEAPNFKAKRVVSVHSFFLTASQAFSNSFLMILVTELGASLRHYLLWGAECAGHRTGMSGKSSGSHRLCPCSLIRWLLAQSLERCKPSDFVEGSICQRENMRKCSIGGTSMIDTGLVTWTSNSPWWRLCLPWLFGLRADVHLANYHVTPTARLNVDLWRCVKMITRWLDNTRVLKVVPAQIQPPASQRSGEIRNEVQWFIESLSIYSQIQIVSGVETVKRGKRYH